MNALRDTFLYFAKYPVKSGVLELFNRTDSNLFAGYATLKAAVEALDPHSLIPDIAEFVFGVNEESVKKRIQQLEGTYLFIDYGHIVTTSDQYDRHTDDMLLSLTVARPYDISKLDHVEQVLMADHCLYLLLQIRTQMQADSECPFVQQLTFPTEITPFFARELSDSIGWTMVFKKRGIEMLG